MQVMSTQQDSQLALDGSFMELLWPLSSYCAVALDELKLLCSSIRGTLEAS